MSKIVKIARMTGTAGLVRSSLRPVERGITGIERLAQRCALRVYAVRVELDPDFHERVEMARKQMVHGEPAIPGEAAKRLAELSAARTS